jgi:tetratricopeptide (TPR) repeat protein
VHGLLGQRHDAEASFLEAQRLMERLVEENPTDSNYEQGLAGTWFNLARLYREGRRMKKSEQAFGRALQHQLHLVTVHPAVVLYRSDLARTWNQVGLLHQDRGQMEQADSSLGKAVAVQQKLLDDHPKEETHARALSRYSFDLENFYSARGKTTKSQRLMIRALPLRRRLAKEHPNNPEHANLLGGSLCNLGNLISTSAPEEALDCYREAIAILEESLRRRTSKGDNSEKGTRQFLHNSRHGRARLLNRLGRQAEALPDWDRLIELDLPPGRQLFRLCRATTLARGGQHVRATAEAKDVLESAKSEPACLYGAAAVYALSSATAREKSLHEQYAARAISLLRQVVAAGLSDARILQADPDLSSLRQR